MSFCSKTRVNHKGVYNTKTGFEITETDIFTTTYTSFNLYFMEIVARTLKNHVDHKISDV